MSRPSASLATWMHALQNVMLIARSMLELGYNCQGWKFAFDFTSMGFANSEVLLSQPLLRRCLSFMMKVTHCGGGGC